MSNGVSFNSPIRGRVLARVLAEDLDKVNGGVDNQTGGTCQITCNDATGTPDITNICGDDGD